MTDGREAPRPVPPPRSRTARDLSRRTAAAAACLLAALVPALLTLAAAASPLRAQSGDRSWRVRDFEARIEVGRDGTLAVSESIRVSFDGSFDGIYREIPVEYETPAGFGYDMDVEIVSVTGAGGESLRREVRREGRHLRVKIWVPGAEDATRSVAIRYRVGHALRFDETTDELYWNVTGTQWPVPIDRASVRLLLPADVQGIRSVAYRGPYGATTEVPTSRPSERTITASARDLRIREGLTVAGIWERGVVSRPTWLDRAAHFLGSNWPIGGGILLAVGMAVLWWRRGRDPEVGTVRVRYEPPAGLRPAAAGILLDHRLHPHDLAAIVVDLAVRGYLEIREGTAEAPDEGYTFRLLRDRGEWADLERHEREMLGALFSPGDVGEETDTDELENSFYRDVEEIRDALYEGPLSGLVRHRSDEVRQRWMAGGLVGVTFLGALPLVYGLRLGGAGPASFAVGVAIAGLAAAGFGYFMPARTAAGTRSMAEVLGFEEFLTRVEEDRFREMIRGPEDFERYLPYAMAFGVAKKWARAFEDLVTEPPEWYAGTRAGHFHPVHFTRSMEGFSEAAGSAMTTRPRGQGGTGGSAFSGGGGFSGGGFGGGGGGAF